MLPVPVAVTVPPPPAKKPPAMGPKYPNSLRVSVPVKAIVAPALLSRETDGALMGPPNVTVPPLRSATDTPPKPL